MESNNNQEFDYLLVLDFEAQCKENVKLDVQEIIELPVVIVDVKNQCVLESNIFHTFVKPTVHTELFDFCKQLTGITQEEVNGGIILTEALEALDKFLEDNGVLKTKFAFVTCGDWDLRTCLPKETKFKKITYKDYLKRWINIKLVFKDFTGNNNRIDMVEMLKEFNIALEGRHHSGKDDTKNIAKIVTHMLNQGKKFESKYVNQLSKKHYY